MTRERPPGGDVTAELAFERGSSERFSAEPVNRGTRALAGTLRRALAALSLILIEKVTSNILPI